MGKEDFWEWASRGIDVFSICEPHKAAVMVSMAAMWDVRGDLMRSADSHLDRSPRSLQAEKRR